MSDSTKALLEDKYGAAAGEPNGVVMRLLTPEEIDFVSGAGEHAMGFGSSYSQSGPGSFAQGVFSSYSQVHEGPGGGGEQEKKVE